MDRAAHEAMWPYWLWYVATIPAPGDYGRPREVLAVGSRDEFPSSVGSLDLLCHCQDKVVQSGRCAQATLPDLEVWIITQTYLPLVGEVPPPDWEEELATWAKGLAAFETHGGFQIFPAQVLDAWCAPEIGLPEDAEVWVKDVGPMRGYYDWLGERFRLRAPRPRARGGQTSGIRLLVANQEFAPGIVPCGYVISSSEVVGGHTVAGFDPFFGRVLDELPWPIEGTWQHLSSPQWQTMLSRAEVAERLWKRSLELNQLLEGSEDPRDGAPCLQVTKQRAKDLG